MPTARLASLNLENRYALPGTPWAGRDYEKLVQAVGLVSITGRDGSLVSYHTTEASDHCLVSLDVEL